MKNKFPFLPMSAFDDEEITPRFAEGLAEKIEKNAENNKKHEFGKLLHSELPIVTVPKPR